MLASCSARQTSADLPPSSLHHRGESCPSSLQASLACGKDRRQAPALVHKHQRPNSAHACNLADLATPLEAKDTWRASDAAAVSTASKQTPLKHERVSLTAESPPDALSYNSSSPGNPAKSSSVFSAGDGTARLKLKLSASHPALGQLIERCGFNAQLQLTFKPGGKSMGRYCSTCQRAACYTPLFPSCCCRPTARQRWPWQLLDSPSFCVARARADLARVGQHLLTPCLHVGQGGA